MKTPFSKTDWVNNRNKALLRAGEGGDLRGLVALIVIEVEHRPVPGGA